MKDKTTMSYHSIHIRMARIKKSVAGSVGENVEEKNPHTMLVEMYNGTATLESNLVVLQMIKYTFI